MNIVVCVGDSCYAKDSCKIAGEFRKLIREYRLNDVSVSASFCMRHCSPKGISAEIGSKLVTGITQENVNGVFKKYVLNPAACLSR